MCVIWLMESVQVMMWAAEILDLLKLIGVAVVQMYKHVPKVSPLMS